MHASKKKYSASLLQLNVISYLSTVICCGSANYEITW